MNQNTETLPISKNHLEKILKPISRLTDSCVLRTHTDHLISICSSENHSVILYASINLPIKLEQNYRINIIDVKRLLVGLNCLGDDGEFSINLERNNMVCQMKNNNEKTHFKYHLVDDSVVKEHPIKIDKIKNLTFDTSFHLKQDKIKKILAASSFATDASKVYFNFNKDSICAEIDDKTMQNIDNVTIPLTQDFQSENFDYSVVLSLDVFKNLVLSKNDVLVKLNNEHKLLSFSLNDDDVMLKYFVSALIK
jgi:hypothetical protein